MVGRLGAGADALAGAGAGADALAGAGAAALAGAGAAVLAGAETVGRLGADTLRVGVDVAAGRLGVVAGRLGVVVEPVLGLGTDEVRVGVVVLAAAGAAEVGRLGAVAVRFGVDAAAGRPGVAVVVLPGAAAAPVLLLGSDEVLLAAGDELCFAVVAGLREATLGDGRDWACGAGAGRAGGVPVTVVVDVLAGVPDAGAIEDLTVGAVAAGVRGEFPEALFGAVAGATLAVPVDGVILRSLAGRWGKLGLPGDGTLMALGGFRLDVR